MNRLHHQGEKNQRARNNDSIYFERASVASYVVFSSPNLFTLMLETIFSFETSTLTTATRHHIPEDGILLLKHQFVMFNTSVPPLRGTNDIFILKADFVILRKQTIFARCLGSSVGITMSCGLNGQDWIPDKNFPSSKHPDLLWDRPNPLSAGAMVELFVGKATVT
jgi:hypothetical protein